jgi:hypothetical protein
MKYPIVVQLFEKLRMDDLVYVDKTAFVYQLLKEGLLLSTIETCC